MIDLNNKNNKNNNRTRINEYMQIYSFTIDSEKKMIRYTNTKDDKRFDVKEAKKLLKVNKIF